MKGVFYIMNKKVLVLLGSPRKNGNTELLTNEFIKGAMEAGNAINKVAIREKNINGCIGCCACQKNGGHCFQKDDMQPIYEAMLNADVIAFASPVYFYNWTSLMKKVIDRTFAIEKALNHKKFIPISTCAAPEEKYMQTMINSYQQYIGCFRGESNENGGYVIGYGTNLPGDVANSPAMKQPYELGLNL